MKILLVEDNPGDVLLIKEMLKEYETACELITASKLSQGLALIDVEKPNLILLDLLLPDSDGMETFTRIHSRANYIPVILLTGNLDQAMARTVVKKGAQDFLVKGRFDSDLLFRAIDYAIGRKQAENWQHYHHQTMARVERINSMGEVALTIAHELNQPLTAIVACAQACARGLNSNDENLRAEVINKLQQISQQAERAGAIVHRLKKYVYKGKLSYENIQLDVLIKDTVSLLNSELQKASITLQWILADDIPTIKVDSIQLQQVILNLVRNSIEALTTSTIEKPTICIRTEQVNKRYVSIGVLDNGSGFPLNKAAHLFEPYYTTKPTGSGIGLAICKTIVEAHGGTITAQQNSPVGACFNLTLPLINK